MSKRRRLIGPALLALALCGFWTGEASFAEWPWSILSFVSNPRAIFFPASDPALDAWLKNIALPASLIAILLVVLSLSIVRAKRGVTETTPLPGAVSHSATAAKAVPAWSSAGEASPKRWVGGLFGRFIVVFATIAVVLSVAACMIAYRHIYGITDQNLKSRAEAMALGLADLSARHLEAGTFDGLPAEIGRYAWDRSIAYVYVEDAQGRIVGHTPADLPRYLSRDFPRSAERAINGIEVNYRGEPVYEIAKRFGGASGGFVRLSVWRAASSEETRLAVTPVVLAVFALLLGAVGIFAAIVDRLNRPFLRLLDHAGRISKGDWGVPLEVRRGDEIGDIARSLERLRSSLRAVVARLERSRRTMQSGL